MPTPLEIIAQLRVVPLVVLDDVTKAAPLIRALVDGGLPCAEVALRTPAALEAITSMTHAAPDALVGAGTVLTPAQVDAAERAGARFIVSPGLNPAVVTRAKERGLAVIPGACTPTELEAALRLGVKTVKFFPAEPMGGLAFLEAMAAPYAGVRFMPSGGITAALLKKYLASPVVMAVSGSWLTPSAMIAASDFVKVRAAAKSAVRVARASGSAESA